MNGIEKITARIQEDSQKEIDAVLAEARAKAADIAAKAKAEAKAVADEVLAQGRRAAEEREDRLASTTQMECRKAALAAKQDVIEEAFQRAHKQLLALPTEKYVALLADLAVQASATGKEKLIFSPSHRAQVGKAVVTAANKKREDAAFTLAEETRPMDGGFILSDGAVEVNCTFDTLIRLQRGALAGEVAKVLFE
ncbi:MAG: hypothetical protein K2K53_10365 [Oscillospiraceae bacterium]|nr:hypothetical protein [Oscillospiraceae bacterium]